MDKLKMHSQDKVKEHIAQIAALFPNALTEITKNGKVEQAIDFDILKQELSDIVVDGPAERYQFTWPDKKKSILLANAPIAKTLRPCREESVDFDTTENLYIEGDNLDALKLLQETYLGKVKIIYIDPPYNTGNDFIYKDDFTKNADEYKMGSGQFDDEGGQLVANIESNGRFHTDWLNMIFPRLLLARNFLRDDGVIFVSIDDNEIENLKKILNEIFKETNFIGQLVWKKKYTGGKHARFYADMHEYILVYAKNIEKTPEISISRSDDEKEKFILEDEYLKDRGRYYTRPLKSNLEERKTLIYPITMPDGTIVKTQWLVGQDRFNKEIAEKRIEFRQKRNGDWQVYKKYYEFDGEGKIRPPSLIEKFPNTEAKVELKKIFPVEEGRDNIFYTVKPLGLMRFLFGSLLEKDDITLDFFAGSSTTAHAIMQLNEEDGGYRRFILVQLPEETDKQSEAYKIGYKNICEIGKERIRRAGNKIINDAGLLAQNLDTGFRVLKVDTTNLEDVYYTPGSYQQNLLNSLADNIKPDRDAEDLLFQVMLDLGILLSSAIQEILVGGKKVYSVADGYLLACFDKNVNSETVTEIAKRKPYYAIFRDSSMSDDSVAINFDQIFTTYSPTTVRKVL